PRTHKDRMRPWQSGRHPVLCIRALREGFSAVLDALPDFGQNVRAFRSPVFVFDGGLNGPFFLLKQLEHFDDRGIPLAERNVRIVVLLVLDVDVRDVIVVLFDKRNGRDLVACREVADIEVDAIPGVHRYGLLPALRAAERFLAGDVRVAVIADPHLVLFGEFAQALDLALFAFRRDGVGAEILRGDEEVVEYVVLKRVDVVDFDDLDQDPGVFVLLAEAFDLVLREPEPPFGQICSSLVLSSLLLGSKGRASASATGAASTAATSRTGRRCAARGGRTAGAIVGR